jgi:hypothetical protein
MDTTVNYLIELLITFSTTYLLPFMVLVFVMAIILRGLTFYSLRRQLYFCNEFSKRVREYYVGKSKIAPSNSFFWVARQMLMLSFSNVFLMRKKFMRRGSDKIMSISDRIFLIEPGITRIIKDTLSQIKYLKRSGSNDKLLDISKDVFDSNPIFSKVIGLLPLGLVNDYLNILPGLFIIGGIFGTFLGIMKALPQLGAMDLTDPEGAKQIMDLFLIKISFSMSTSIVGILLSVAMTTLNTLLSPEKLFLKVVNTFTAPLNLIWNETTTNNIPQTLEKTTIGDKRK